MRRRDDGDGCLLIWAAMVVLCLMAGQGVQVLVDATIRPQAQLQAHERHAAQAHDEAGGCKR